MFSLKSSSPVYAVLSANTFISLIQMWQTFLWPDVLPHINPVWWWGPVILSKLKKNSPAHEMETIPPGIKMVFQEVSWVNLTWWWRPLFYWDIISRWFLIKAEEPFICLCTGGYTLSYNTLKMETIPYTLWHYPYALFILAIHTFQTRKWYISSYFMKCKFKEVEN